MSIRLLKGTRCLQGLFVGLNSPCKNNDKKKKKGRRLGDLRFTFQQGMTVAGGSLVNAIRETYGERQKVWRNSTEKEQEGKFPDSEEKLCGHILEEPEV